MANNETRQERVFRTRDLMAALPRRQSLRTIQLFLREKFPKHEGQWRFNEEEFRQLVSDLSTRNTTRRRGGLRFR